MVKVAVVGAGMQAKGVCYDILRQADVEEIRLADIAGKRALSMAGHFNDTRIVPSQLQPDNIASLFSGVDAAISCAPYSANIGLTETAVLAGVSFCDLGGNNDVVERQRDIAEEHGAEKNGVSIVPACGLAPGMPAHLVADVVQDFDSVDSFVIKVGGIPQKPGGLLDYALVFSITGLLNEYLEPARVLRDGKIVLVESLTELDYDHYDLPAGTRMEDFVTSGALCTLPHSFAGQIREMRYKTVRYPGHCSFFATAKKMGLLRDDVFPGGGMSPRGMFEWAASRAFAKDVPDLVVLKAAAIGTLGGKHRGRLYKLSGLPQDGLTAMMRCTAFPASIVLLMLARGQVSMKGFAPIEHSIDPKLFLNELDARGLKPEVTEW